MNYQEALSYIHSRPRMSKKLGVDNIRAVLKRLDDPQKKLKFIHIAGTNGKGSTAAMTESVLHAAGYKTGLFISPFIDEFNERIQINRENISDGDLARITTYVSEAVQKAESEEDISPVSEFEIVTAVGLCYFVEQQCDFVVLEVGMGGRLDSTNVIDTPLVSVITSISFDHMQFLGDTLSKIAGEKCGIIKDNGITVMYPLQDDEVVGVVKKYADEKKNRLVVPELKEVSVKKESIKGTKFSYKGLNLTCPLAGAHQVNNCVTAIETLLALRGLGVKISDDQIRRGIASTRFAGRLEIVKEKPVVLFDGGHNPDGISKLSDAVMRFVKPDYERLYVIMGMVGDKDYKKCIEKVASLADVFMAVAPGNPRALSPQMAAQAADEFCERTYFDEDTENAIKKVLDNAEEHDAVLICGSLYLLGDARKYVKKYYINTIK
ncbi:MAG: folylpolyglutamate synthase/dihydrofolate synthase family protein [Bacillota bacterium]|nr:folylpolyglutamate synthase/dihydrofolate synthase family protein [Bacillota bacterium]